MVAVGFLTYGLGIAPAYYGLGVFASALIADLDLTRQQIGEIRLFLIGVIGALGPILAGAAADRTGSYAGTLWTLAALAVLGAASIWFCRPPDRSVLTGESKTER